MHEHSLVHKDNTRQITNLKNPHVAWNAEMHMKRSKNMHTIQC